MSLWFPGFVLVFLSDWIIWFSKYGRWFFIGSDHLAFIVWIVVFKEYQKSFSKDWIGCFRILALLSYTCSGSEGLVKKQKSLKKFSAG